MAPPTVTLPWTGPSPRPRAGGVLSTSSARASGRFPAERRSTATPSWMLPSLARRSWPPTTTSRQPRLRVRRAFTRPGHHDARVLSTAAAGGLVDLSSRADTIVLGRSGHGRVVGALLGSVALQVVTHAQCPVVVVQSRTGPVEGPGSRGERRRLPVSELALGYAFEQASWRGVHLDVVHAWWTTVPSGLTQGIRADQITQERLTLSESLVGWSEKYPDVEVRKSIPMGPVVLTLTEAAEERRAARRGQSRTGRVPQPPARVGQPGSAPACGVHCGRGTRAKRRPRALTGTRCGRHGSVPQWHGTLG